jgi:hypothetical protein
MIKGILSHPVGGRAIEILWYKKIKSTPQGTIVMNPAIGRLVDFAILIVWMKSVKAH